RAPVARATPRPAPGGSRRWPGTRGSAGRGPSPVRACLGPVAKGGNRIAAAEKKKAGASPGLRSRVSAVGSVLACLHGLALGLGLLLAHLGGDVLGAVGDGLGGIGLAFLVGLLHRVGGRVDRGGGGTHGGGGAGGSRLGAG